MGWPCRKRGAGPVAAFMISWSTDELRPHERFEHWREVRGRHLAGVTMEVEHDRQASFRGAFFSQPVGGALFSEIRSSAYDVTRTAADIGRVSSDSLRISQLIAGPAWCETPAGRVYLGTGSLATSYTDLPFAIRQRPGADMHVRLLRIPLEGRLRLAGRQIRDYHTTVLTPDGRYARLLMAAFMTLAEEAGQLETGDAERSVAHLARLVLLSRGSVRAGEPESRAAVRDACLKAALRLIRNNLARQDLGVDTLARALGISVRQMHVVFEPTGSTCQATITAMRIAEVRRQLLAAPGRSVTDIAFACGFDSLSTFYRAFRRVDDTTPGDYRQAALDIAAE